MEDSYYDKKGNKVWIYYPTDSENEYSSLRKVLRVVDNGNGFTIKSYSWTSTEPDTYWNIPYNVAGDLVDALEHFDYRDEP